MDVRFKTLADFYIWRQTQCGKSYVVRRMLQHLNELFHPVPTKVIYCYGEYQKEFDELFPYVQLVEGFPNDVGKTNTGAWKLPTGTRWSHVTMFQRSTCCRFIYAWFPSSRNIRALLDAEFISTGQIVTYYQFKFSLHSGLSKSTRLLGHYNVGEANVSWRHKLPDGSVPWCHEKTVWLFTHWLSPINPRGDTP